MPAPTIYQVLAQEVSIYEWDLSPTHHGHANSWITPTFITPWSDFNLANIIAAYGDILKNPATEVSGISTNFKISNLADIKDMEAGFFHCLLTPPLEAGLEALAPRLGLDSGSFPISRNRQIGTVRPPSSFSCNGQTMIVGAMRTSIDWSSENPGAVLLFDQLLGYANQSCTRYGYAVTDKEFVATQAYLDDHDNMAIRYSAIPLSNSGTEQLTPALALWCLAMMALSPYHHAPAHHTSTHRMNTWYRDERPDGSVTYMHHLSYAVRTTLPPLEGVDLLDAPRASQ